uniref:Retrovirus-related Pol polyprotein from transposon TNT 1-94 n=1 Tax=Tanacetum cinerariifolium TaxID=118510 RepID=A0A6L2J3L7_TANCI|nr:retrovirus-related Pol polyprotein from transposon TNT 1-94 [Tanacetum cinerariifolium]
MISKEDSGSKIDLEKIQQSTNEEPIVNTNTQQKVVTPVKPDDISLHIRKTSVRFSKPPQFYYGFHIEEDKISDSTLKELDEPANYKEAMASPAAAKVGCKCIFKKKIDMDGGAMKWKSLKQDTVADSTCESEYIVACEALKEAIWIKNFIGDLRVIPIVQDPIEIFCDNESVVTLTKEPKDHGKSKLIERKYHFV